MDDIATILQDGKDPSIPALRAWLMSLAGSVSAASNGFRTFESLSALNAYTPTGDEPSYAFLADGEVFQPYRYDGESWVVDDAYFAGVGTIVQPLIDQVQGYLDESQVSAELASQGAAASIAAFQQYEFSETLSVGLGATAGTGRGNGQTRGLARTLAEYGMIGDNGLLQPFSIYMTMGGNGSFYGQIVQRTAVNTWRVVAEAAKTIGASGAVSFVPADFPSVAGAVLGADYSFAVYAPSTGAQIEFGPGSGWVLLGGRLGTTPALVEAATNEPKISASVRHGSLLARTSKTEAAVAKIGDVPSLKQPLFGAADPLANGTAASNSSTRWFASTAAVAIPVNRIDIYAAQAGVGTLKCATYSGTDVTVTRQLPFTLSAGLNTFRAPADFAAFTLAVGETVGWKGTTGLVATQTGAAGVSRAATVDIGVGATAATTASSLIQQINVCNEVKQTVQDQISGLTARIDGYVTPATDRALLDQRFASAAGLTLSGATVSNGLVSAVSSSWSSFSFATDYGYSSISKRTLSAWATISSAGQVWGVGYKPLDLLDGTAAIVDGADNTLKIYKWDGSTSPGSVIGSPVAIPWSLNGSRVRLDLKKVRLKTIISLTNIVTQQQVSVTTDKANAGDPYPGRQWGVPGVLFPSTTASGVTVTRLLLVPDEPKPRPTAARLLIIGDSITEASALPAGQDYSKGWAYQLADARFAAIGLHDVVVAGRGGDESTNMLGRLSEVLELCDANSEVWLAIGTNDSAQATWRTNTATALARIAAKTQRIRQIALAPRGTAARAAINADIVANYFGLGLPPIRMDLALSAGNDGATWNPAFDLGDGIHPNIAGNNAMFAQALIDAPEALL
nr:SGNH/GDSL hydrolase family protein [uncultured Sphingomonas sp.]